MSQKIQPVRGTQDFLPKESLLYRNIESLAYKTCSLYGFKEISTPMFEFSDVFHRSLGETSDAVSKETYDFKDRGGDSLTLRPEGTASVVRAFISNGMAQDLPLKLYYSGPMFRYERPQKGRYRQFHQIGVEALGYESPLCDVETIDLAWQILENLQLTDKCQIEINSLGDKESRQKHREALLNYLIPFKNELSADSQIRLEKNPLRILDSKDEKDKKIISTAPNLEDFLNDSSKLFFDKVQSGLDKLNLNAILNKNLVRGLDYYTHTVFEITTSQLGSQSAVISGGRYDGLVEQLGGPSTQGFGWGGGLERLMLLVSPENNIFTHNEKLYVVLPADEQFNEKALSIAKKLRTSKLISEVLFSGNIGKKMKKANKMNADFALIIGESEIANNAISVKNLKTGNQTLVTENNLVNDLLSM